MVIKCLEMHEITHSFIGCLNCPQQITAPHVSHQEIIFTHVGLMTFQCVLKIDQYANQNTAVSGK